MAIGVLLSLSACGGPQADAEDDELGRLHRRDADHADQPAVVDVGLRHRRAVALDEERLLAAWCPRARRCARRRSGSSRSSRRTRAHSGSALGSNTTHCRPRSIDSSMKINSRRTLTYFQSGSLVITRAPQTRMPRLFGAEVADHVDVRRDGLRMSCSPLLIVRCRPVMPRTTSLAGALCTPRSMSVRA